MSKKRTRNLSNNTTDVEMQVNNINASQKIEQIKTQQITPVSILLYIF